MTLPESIRGPRHLKAPAETERGQLAEEIREFLEIAGRISAGPAVQEASPAVREAELAVKEHASKEQAVKEHVSREIQG